MNLRDALAALRRAWWLPVIGLLAGAGAAFAVSASQTPLYSSSTQLFVSTTTASSTTDVLQGSMFSEQRVTSYASLLAGEDLAARIVDRLDLDRTPADLARRISATAVPQTVLLQVTVLDPSPELAQQIAAAVGEEFPDLVTALETPDGGGVSPVKVTVTDRPEVAAAPVSPQTTRNVALGAVVGLVLGAGVALLRARLDRSVRDPEVASHLGGAPVMGTVLRDHALVNEHVLPPDSTSAAAESYRKLRTNLQFIDVDKPPRTIMISSALPSEGKTTLVLNLAAALTEAGSRVAIVEADLRRPRVTRYLGLVGGVGLTNVLAGTAEVHEVLQAHGRRSLSVLPAGPTPPNPSQLLSSSHMGALLRELREDNDFVLVDAPPVLPVADALGLAAQVDGVILSVRHGQTTKQALQQAAVMMERVGAKVLGIVLNMVPPKADIVAGYSHAYSDEVVHREGQPA